MNEKKKKKWYSIFAEKNLKMALKVRVFEMHVEQGEK